MNREEDIIVSSGSNKLDLSLIWKIGAGIAVVVSLVWGASTKYFAITNAQAASVERVANLESRQLKIRDDMSEMRRLTDEYHIQALSALQQVQEVQKVNGQTAETLKEITHNLIELNVNFKNLDKTLQEVKETVKEHPGNH